LNKKTSTFFVIFLLSSQLFFLFKNTARARFLSDRFVIVKNLGDPTRVASSQLSNYQNAPDRKEEMINTKHFSKFPAASSHLSMEKTSTLLSPSTS
jgi:hypothetical protein